MAHPRGRDDGGGEARQPGVCVAVGRTRLGGEGAAVAQTRRRVVLAGGGSQQGSRLVGDVGGDDLLAVRGELLEDVLVTVGYRLDGLRRALLAGVRMAPNTEAICSGEEDTEPRIFAGKGEGTSPSSVMPML